MAGKAWRVLTGLRVPSESGQEFSDDLKKLHGTGGKPMTKEEAVAHFQQLCDAEFEVLSAPLRDAEKEKLLARLAELEKLDRLAEEDEEDID